MFQEESPLRQIYVMGLRTEADADQNSEVWLYHREEVLCPKTTYPVGAMPEVPESSRRRGP